MSHTLRSQDWARVASGLAMVCPSSWCLRCSRGSLFCRQVFKHASPIFSKYSVADAQHSNKGGGVASESINDVLQRLSVVGTSLCGSAARSPKSYETHSTQAMGSVANDIAAPMQTVQGSEGPLGHGSALHQAMPAVHLSAAPPLQLDNAALPGDAHDAIASHSAAFEALLQHSMQREQLQPLAPAAQPQNTRNVLADSPAVSRAADQDALWSEVQNLRMMSLSTARSVPSSPLSRVAGFGQLGIGMAAGAVGEFFKRSTAAASGNSGSAAPLCSRPVAISHAGKWRAAGGEPEQDEGGSAEAGTDAEHAGRRHRACAVDGDTGARATGC